MLSCLPACLPADFLASLQPCLLLPTPSAQPLCFAGREHHPFPHPYPTLTPHSAPTLALPCRAGTPSPPTWTPRTSWTSCPLTRWRHPCPRSSGGCLSAKEAAAWRVLVGVLEAWEAAVGAAAGWRAGWLAGWLAGWRRGSKQPASQPVLWPARCPACKPRFSPGTYPPGLAVQGEGAARGFHDD
jgi:hypothetical protein